ncbi:MAG: TrkH family potassium uptake protein, partial [Pseudomonadota bacterium]
NLPRGVLLWRAILQWIGGIGIIVTAIAILPMLKVGGMQLFQMESSDASGKFLPRVSEIASQTGLVYVGLTALCAALYRVAGMGDFDALAHAFTTVSAGGFSTTDESFGAFVSGGADMVAIVFMMLAGLPFGLMVLALRGNLTAFLRDPQPRVFFFIAISAATLMTLYISRAAPELIGPEGPIRAATFNVVSILTGTGYGTTNFGAWGPFASALFLVLMFLGGCAGSAACGMKTFRIHITFLALQAYARGMARPNRVAPVRYAGRIVRRETMQSIMLFMFLYLASFAVLASALAMMRDIDAVTAISAAAASISNVGPGLGEMVGPTGTYQDFPVLAKWLCAFAMLLGRLELIAAFVILSPRFWRG